MTSKKNLRRNISALFSLAILTTLTACGGSKPIPTKARYDAVAFQDIPDWQNDTEIGQALAGFQRSCTAWDKSSPDRMLGKGDMKVQAASWQQKCSIARTLWPLDHAAARQFFETQFVPMHVSPLPDNGGLVTGYYEPLLFGSRTCGGRYNVPLYRLPPDRVAGTEYYDRRAIYAGALANKGLELVCVDDPIGAFFLEIQGSGRIVLAEGGMMQVGYAGQNGHEFIPIGRIMVQDGILEKGKVTLFSIKQWLRSHPEQAQALMEENPSYVFFQERTGEGPIGAQGVPLTPQRSVAVDPRFAPYGAPIFLRTTLPAAATGTNINPPFTRLMLAQDTGGAIKGPARADLFFGFEPPAELLAGGMKQPGDFYVLLPSELAGTLNGTIVE